jgi:hypothetical protein
LSTLISSIAAKCGNAVTGVASRDICEDVILKVGAGGPNAKVSPAQKRGRIIGFSPCDP